MIIIHDVVMQQGEIVNQLHRRRAGERYFCLGSHCFGGKNGERRSQGLAATIIRPCPGLVDPSPVVLDHSPEFRLQTGARGRHDWNHSQTRAFEALG